MDTGVANPRKKIIIFEDDISFRSSYISALETRGFEVTAFTSPNDVTAEEIKKINPHLLSFDIFMPGKTGVEAVIEYKKDPALSGIPFIFVSSQEGELKEQALQLKPVGFFHKFSEPISRIVQHVDDFLRP